jgi:hypothetical protein
MLLFVKIIEEVSSFRYAETSSGLKPCRTIVPCMLRRSRKWFFYTHFVCALQAYTQHTNNFRSLKVTGLYEDIAPTA